MELATILRLLRCCDGSTRFRLSCIDHWNDAGTANLLDVYAAHRSGWYNFRQVPFFDWSNAGVFSTGGAFGILASTYIMERRGRKASTIFCAILGLVGGAVICASQNIEMFVPFKFVAGMDSWGFVTISK